MFFMRNINKLIEKFYKSQYGKPFVLVFLSYCWVAIFLSPELTWEEIETPRFLWNLILDLNPLWISRFNLSHLAYYFPVKVLCFLGFPAIMGANLAAFFGEKSIPKKAALFCWTGYPYEIAYPGVVDSSIERFFSIIALVAAIYLVTGFLIIRFLGGNPKKIHLQMIVAVFISVLTAILITRSRYDFTYCGFDWEKAKDEMIFFTHFNPVIAFLLGYLGMSIMTRLTPALIHSMGKIKPIFGNKTS